MRNCYINRVVTTIAEDTLKGLVNYTGRRVFASTPYWNKRRKSEKRHTPRGPAFKRMMALEINRLKREAAHEEVLN